jgi:hypothetical protein
MNKIQITMPIEHANALKRVLDKAALKYMLPTKKEEGDKIFDLLNDLRGFLSGSPYISTGIIEIKGIDNE